MKKTTITVIALLLVNLATFAQDSGSLLVGGEIAFPTNQNGDVFSFSPRGIYMLNENFSVGAGLVINSDRDDQGGDTFNRTNQFGLAPEARYFFDLGESVKVYGRASFSFLFGGTTFVDGNNTTDVGSGSTISLGINPGLFYSISDNIILDISLNLFNFSSNSFTPAGSNTTTTNNSTGLGINTLQPNFALYWKF